MKLELLLVEEEPADMILGLGISIRDYDLHHRLRLLNREGLLHDLTLLADQLLKVL